MRLGLLVLVTFGSAALTWLILRVPQSAHAATTTEYATTKEPLGVAQDGTNLWVAEPGCDPLGAGVCSSTIPGIIGEYSLTNPNNHTDFSEPGNFSSPAFLALDGHGNIWFTEPNTDAIGELTPSGSGVWNQWQTGITAGAAPFDLVFDKNGNIWFTEGNRDTVGFFNTTTHTAVETALRAGVDPDGIMRDAAGTIWFAEDNAGKLESFTPTTNGTISTTSVFIGQINPQFMAQDAQGNLWYSEGRNVAIGEYNTTTHQHADFSLASVITGGTYVGGIGVDKNGLIWFDEGTSGDVGYFNPASQTATVVATLALPRPGLLVDGANRVWVTERPGKLAEIVPGGTPPPPPPSPSPTGSPVPTLPPGPVSKTWYFAEGHIGKGFQEYLTVQNPDPLNACAVSFQYLLSGGAQAPITVKVNPNTRWTENVDQDLGIARNGSAAEDVSTIVSVSTQATPNCSGVVAERPMYFTNLFGASSGHDALGATHLGTSFYFPDVSSSSGYRDFITILNPPGGSAASVTATYEQGGASKGTDTLTVQPGTRGTISPQNCGCTSGVHVSAVVSSTQPVDVELPIYFSSFQAGNAGSVNGAAVVVGAQAPSNDWRFAEGYIGGHFQEDLVLSNFSTTAVSASMVLEYDSGTTLTVPVTIPAQGSATEDINHLTALGAGAGTCSTPCNLTQNISVEVTAPSGSNFVAERELYFQYNHAANGRSLSAAGGTAVIGQSGAASTRSYSFAEGYTNTDYDEWLTLQNPTGSAETIYVTIVNGYGHPYSFPMQVGPKTRATVDLVKTVLSKMCVAGAAALCWEISLTVQTASNGGAFVAERPMYYNASSSQGGTVVIGYVGG